MGNFNTVPKNVGIRAPNMKYVRVHPTRGTLSVDGGPSELSLWSVHTTPDCSAAYIQHISSKLYLSIPSDAPEFALVEVEAPVLLQRLPNSSKFVILAPTDAQGVAPVSICGERIFEFVAAVEGSAPPLPPPEDGVAWWPFAGAAIHSPSSGAEEPARCGAADAPSGAPASASAGEAASSPPSSSAEASERPPCAQAESPAAAESDAEDDAASLNDAAAAASAVRDMITEALTDAAPGLGGIFAAFKAATAGEQPPAAEAPAAARPPSSAVPAVPLASIFSAIGGMMGAPLSTAPGTDFFGGVPPPKSAPSSAPAASAAAAGSVPPRPRTFDEVIAAAQSAAASACSTASAAAASAQNTAQAAAVAANIAGILGGLNMFGPQPHPLVTQIKSGLSSLNSLNLDSFGVPGAAAAAPSTAPSDAAAPAEATRSAPAPGARAEDVASAVAAGASAASEQASAAACQALRSLALTFAPVLERAAADPSLAPVLKEPAAALAAAASALAEGERADLKAVADSVVGAVRHVAHDAADSARNTAGSAAGAAKDAAAQATAAAATAAAAASAAVSAARATVNERRSEKAAAGGADNAPPSPAATSEAPVADAPAGPAVRCLEGHAMSICAPCRGAWFCDVCRAFSPQNGRERCNDCDFDLCGSCAATARAAFAARMAALEAAA